MHLCSACNRRTTNALDDEEKDEERSCPVSYGMKGRWEEGRLGRQAEGENVLTERTINRITIRTRRRAGKQRGARPEGRRRRQRVDGRAASTSAAVGVQPHPAGSQRIHEARCVPVLSVGRKSAGDADAEQMGSRSASFVGQKPHRKRARVVWC